MKRYCGLRGRFILLLPAALCLGLLLTACAQGNPPDTQPPSPPPDQGSAVSPLFDINVYPPEARFSVQLAAAGSSLMVEPAQLGLKGDLTPSPPFATAAGERVTRLESIYADVFAVLRAANSDRLAVLDIFAAPAEALTTLYQCPDGFRIVGLCEGAKFRAYWLESDGSHYRLMTGYMADGLEAVCVDQGEYSAGQPDELTLAPNGWNDYLAFLTKDAAGDLRLHPFSIWDAEDDFGIGQMQPLLPLDAIYAGTATYGCYGNYLARPVRTETGGGVELLRAGDLPNGGEDVYKAGLYLLGGETPADAILLADSFCVLVDQALYAVSLDGKDVTLIFAGVDWARRLDGGWLAFAAEGGEALYLCQPDFDFQTTRIMRGDGVRFVDITLTQTELTSAYIAQEVNGESSVICLILDIMAGD